MEEAGIHVMVHRHAGNPAAEYESILSRWACQTSAKGVRYHVQEARVSTTNATKARQNLFRLIDQVNDSHEPVLITGKKGSAVLVSESDWKAIEETLYLNSIPGMAASIREGIDTPTSDLDESLEWE